MIGVARAFTDPRYAFGCWGLSGLLTAVGLGAALTRANGLSLAVTAGLAGAAVVTFGLLTLLSGANGRGTRLVYYHHELAILAVSTGLLAAPGRPVLPYLDVVVLGVGAFLALGRVGCLLAGCCHGRPARYGVRYGPRYTEFPPHLVGVRLVPVQAYEAAGVAVVVLTGAVLTLHGPAGAALVWYVAAYGCLRFGLEFLRGDADRPTWLGYSQAQWISVLLCVGSITGATTGLLPRIPVDVLALLGMTAAMLVVRYRSTDGVGDPTHTAELGSTVDELAALGQRTVAVRGTSRGVRVSAGAVDGITHYTLSRVPRPLTAGQARTVATRIADLRGSRLLGILPGTRPGIYHALVADPNTNGCPTRRRPVPAGHRRTPPPHDR